MTGSLLIRSLVAATFASRPPPRPMNIFVCVKQVVARDSLLRRNDDETWILDDGLSFEMNEPDTFALEEGLRLKEKQGDGLEPASFQFSLAA